MIKLEIDVTGNGKGMDYALDTTEKLAIENNLNEQDVLRLRLLGEELFGLIRGITGDFPVVYRIEQEETNYKLSLIGDVEMTFETREKLIEVSTKGENLAAKGFMGKLREIVTILLIPSEAKALSSNWISMNHINMGVPTAFAGGTESYFWALSKLKEEIEKSNDEKRQNEKDELEKSIVASIADDVTVNITGTHVEVTISKEF